MSTPDPPHLCKVDDPQQLALDQFEQLDSIKCVTFDVLTGVLIQYPLMQWVTGREWVQHCLVLHGDSDVGKTGLAMAIASDLSTNFGKAHFVKVGSVESLKNAVRAGHMGRGVAILFDEVAVGRKRGTRDGMSLEEVKHITEVNNSTSVEARYENMEIGMDQPRIFTCNGSTPKEWHFQLPSDVLTTMTDSERKSLSPDIKAIFKRVCFAHVQTCVVPVPLRQEFHASKRHRASGSNALPSQSSDSL